MDINLLFRYKQEGFLKCSKHHDWDLFLWNYTDLATIRDKWDDITMSCRGLVTDGCGNIVARAFSKFFNFNEKNAYRPNLGEEYDVLEKIDGSMILFFKYKDLWMTCTRGSFKSEQCIKAVSMLSVEQLSELDGNYTYVFEVVYPQNRVVVNYGKREELVYLATFCNKDGEERNDVDLMNKIGINSVPVKGTKVFHSMKDINLLRDMNLPNEEGYVLHFKNSHARVKVKFPTYVDLHRVVCGLNENTVKEWFSKGCVLEEKLDGIPDEVHEFVKSIWGSLKKDFDETLSCAKTQFSHFYDENRKEFIKKIKGHPMEAVFVKLYDDKCPHQVICKYISRKAQ